MDFPDRLTAQTGEQLRRDRYRAWALVTGLIASLYALGIVSIVVDADFSVEVLLALPWAAGAICGAASLLVIGAVARPSERHWRLLTGGLWIGNAVVSITTLVAPIVLPFAVLPVIGGFVVLRGRHARGAGLYIALPFIALAAGILYSLLA